MYISGCLAYENIEAEIRSIEETVNIGIEMGSNTHINLTLSYLQAKVLAEGIMNFTANIKLEYVKDSNLTGDIKVRMPIEQAINEDMKKSTEQGEEEQCQQNILNAPTEAA